jgi:sporulation protein YlmC with PRC-barrel domain
MLGVEQIGEWLGQEVVDADGESLGKLEDVYYARGQAEPQLALIKSGLLGRKRTIVPLQDATVGREHIRVAFTSEQVAHVSDTVDVEFGETLAGPGAQQLAGVYGVQIAAEEDLDSANALEQRRAEARDADTRASELEAEAREHAEDAKEAQASARERSAQASETEQAACQAREEAERLRS